MFQYCRWASNRKHSVRGVRTGITAAAVLAKLRNLGLRNANPECAAMLALVELNFGEAQIDQTGSKKIRRYGIDVGRLEDLLAAVQRRDEPTAQAVAFPRTASNPLDILKHFNP